MTFTDIFSNEALVLLMIVLALLIIMLMTVSKGLKRFCLFLIGMIGAFSCFAAML